jgi:hypothetical protein
MVDGDWLVFLISRAPLYYVKNGKYIREEPMATSLFKLLIKIEFLKISNLIDARYYCAANYTAKLPV